jgi:hypothetical protein
VAAALAEARLEELDAGRVVLVVPPARLAVLDGEEARRAVLRALRAATGRDLRLVVRQGAAAPGRDGAAQRWREAEAHPVVQEIRRRFRAEVTGREPVAREAWLRRQDSDPPDGDGP